MGDQSRQVFEEALRLPVEQRADLAAELLRSLDEQERTLPSDEVERRWTEEITWRAERALAGELVGRDVETVLGAIESRLRNR
jgi:hypothetical protein